MIKEDKKTDIYSNENLKENLELLEKMGYQYIVKAKDKMLSGWGKSGANGHIQLIAAKDIGEAAAIMFDLERDKTFSHVNYQSISDYKAINSYTRGKSFTIRNDWTRHLKQ